MKMIHKSYKFRISPTKKQQKLLSKHFGHCRFAFNRFLSEWKETYEKDKTSLNYYDNAKFLTILNKETDFSWLKEVNSQSLQASLKNLDTAYKNFFKQQNQFPRFKSKYDRQSFKVPHNVCVVNEKIILPKFKEGIPFKQHRKLEGKILFATVSKTTTGKYDVSITCEQEHPPYPKTGKAVGNMLKNHRLAQAMSDVSLGAFYTMLAYKAKWNQKDYVKIDRFFPSSKRCSNCGWINQDLKLSDREWTCSGCGETHDRDLNASKNILNQGLKILSGCGTQSDVKQKREEALSLDKSMNPEALPISFAVGG